MRKAKPDVVEDNSTDVKNTKAGRRAVGSCSPRSVAFNTISSMHQHQRHGVGALVPPKYHHVKVIVGGNLVEIRRFHQNWWKKAYSTKLSGRVFVKSTDFVKSAHLMNVFFRLHGDQCLVGRCLLGW